MRRGVGVLGDGGEGWLDVGRVEAGHDGAGRWLLEAALAGERGGASAGLLQVDSSLLLLRVILHQSLVGARRPSEVRGGGRGESIWNV